MNRAFTFAKPDAAALERQLTVLFRIVHTGSFNVGVQALMLLHQVVTTHEGVTDRFHRALFSKLLDDNVLRSSKHVLFLNLVFKATKVGGLGAVVGAVCVYVCARACVRDHHRWRALSRRRTRTSRACARS